MEPISFCYWLQGFSELVDQQPTAHQWKMIQEHLNTVFKKETKLTVALGPWASDKSGESTMYCAHPPQNTLPATFPLNMQGWTTEIPPIGTRTC